MRILPRLTSCPWHNPVDRLETAACHGSHAIYPELSSLTLDRGHCPATLCETAENLLQVLRQRIVRFCFTASFI